MISVYRQNDDGAGEWSDYHYMENETLVEQFLLRYKWVRYTYDFGDEWRHKIIYEKTEESYNERCASLLKAKGDNFLEDSGGVWESEESGTNRCAFDKKEAEERLKKLIFPVHDELNETMGTNFSGADMEKMAEELLEGLFNNFMSRRGSSSAAEKTSKMTAKIDRWQQFSDDYFQNIGKKRLFADDFALFTGRRHGRCGLCIGNSSWCQNMRGVIRRLEHERDT